MTFTKYWLSYWLGKWRLWWGFCPNCNNDAPECDTCHVCRGTRAFPPQPETKLLWEVKWANRLQTARSLYKTNKQMESNKSEGE